MRLAPNRRRFRAGARVALTCKSTAGFSGAGSAVLSDAFSGAKYILVGEDHGTAEILQFVSAVCDALQGLAA